MKKKLLLIFFAFSVSFITMVALSLFSLARFSTFMDYADEVTHTNSVIRKLYKTEVQLKDLDRWERGYIITGDTGYRRVMDNVIDSLEPSLVALERLITDNPEQVKNALFLRNSITNRVQCYHRDIAYIDSTGKRQAMNLYSEGRKHMIAANRTIREMHEKENALLRERFKRQEFYEKLTTNTLKSLLFIFCVVTLTLFMLLMKVIRSGMLYQEELQVKVHDLKRSHSELADITYAISHDLHEPLRKIQVFINMLLMRKKPVTEAETVTTLERINVSAGAMQTLIKDLVHLTELTSSSEPRKKVNLNKILDNVVSDLMPRIKEKNALIETARLPDLSAFEKQLRILLGALLDNSLKFSKEGTAPLIEVRYTRVNGRALKQIDPVLANKQFHCVSVADNGIGFDNKYIDNIFKIFRRLHSDQSEYEGKGIGLAICQRIMTNHEGYIIGTGTPGEGAEFKLYFPV
ncbi:MAG: CHASE3 domain-containing protein [Taibaiella sp.]|nr:CHASE3 domain-containing protein [Taibaiella sp.]